MKIMWRRILEKHEPILGNLKVGDTFMFVEYDETTGPFLVIGPKGYCYSKGAHKNARVFVLNLAENTIHHRTTSAKVQPVNCEIVVK